MLVQIVFKSMLIENSTINYNVGYSNFI